MTSVSEIEPRFGGPISRVNKSFVSSNSDRKGNILDAKGN